MQQNSTCNNSFILASKHCHINPPSFVVNDLVDAGVVDVPGDDVLEDLLGDLLDKVEMGKLELLQY